MKNKDALKLKGKWRYKVIDSLTGKVKRKSDWIENLIVLNSGNGLYIVLSQLIGVTTTGIEITSASIGTDDTAPTIADTDLVTATLEDIPIALQSRVASDEVSLTIFINSSELANGDYKEFGLFCDDKLWARSIITPTFTKSDNEDFQVEYSISGSTT